MVATFSGGTQDLHPHYDAGHLPAQAGWPCANESEGHRHRCLSLWTLGFCACACCVIQGVAGMVPETGLTVNDGIAAISMSLGERRQAL